MKVYCDIEGRPIRVGSFSLAEILELLTTINYGLKRHCFPKLEWHRIAEHMNISEPALRSLLSHLVHCYKMRLPYLADFHDVPLDLNVLPDARAMPDFELQQPSLEIPSLENMVPVSRRFSMTAQERLLIFALKIHHMDFAAVRDRFFAGTDVASLIRQYEALKARTFVGNELTPENIRLEEKRGLSEVEIFFELEKTIVTEEVLQKLDEIVKRQQ